MRRRDLSSPAFSGRWCNPDGTLTPLAQTVARRLWERTGYAPGQDATYQATLSERALVSAAQGNSSAEQAQRDAAEARIAVLTIRNTHLQARADEALNTAALALAQIQRLEQRLNLLERDRNSAILLSTAIRTGQAAQSK